MHDPSDPAVLREKAAKCRRLAGGLVDDQSITALRNLAEAYEQEAVALESGQSGSLNHRPTMPSAR